MDLAQETGHANFELISRLSKKDHLYDACQFGKQVKLSFKSKDCISTSRLL